MNLEKSVFYGVLAAGATPELHRALHEVLGAEAIIEVSAALFMLGGAGMWAYESIVVDEYDVPSNILGYSVVGGGSFAVLHELTHGTFFNTGIGLGTGLGEASVILAVGTFVGILLHDYLVSEQEMR